MHASSKTTFSCLLWGNTISSTHCGFPVRTQGYFPKGNIFVARAVRWGNLAMVLGQQPRYQRVSSSVTMWQLFHRGPWFRRGTISYWPGDYYQLIRNEGSGVIDHGIGGVLQGKIQTARVPFTTRDKEIKSHDRFNLGDSSVLLGHPQLVNTVSNVLQSRLVCWHLNGNFSCSPLNIILENPKHI